MNIDTEETVDVNDFLQLHDNVLSHFAEKIQEPNKIENFCEEQCVSIKITPPIVNSDRLNSNNLIFSNFIKQAIDSDMLVYREEVEFLEYSDKLGYKSLVHDIRNIFNTKLILTTLDDKEIIIEHKNVYTKLQEIMDKITEINRKNNKKVE